MSNQLRTEVARAREASRLLLAKALRSRRAGNRSPVVYNCETNDCLLLTVDSTPDGYRVYQPSYTYSANEAARQRAARMSFDARSYLLDPIVEDNMIPSALVDLEGRVIPGVKQAIQVQCDHLVLTLDAGDLRADAVRAVRSGRRVKRHLSARDTPRA